MEAGFQRLESRLEDKMGAGFDRLDRDFDRLDRDIRELRQAIFRFGGGFMVGLVGVILTLLGVIGAIIATN
jgi:hypothetical protein